MVVNVHPKRPIVQLDKPNVTIPLASSYNDRNVAGFTTTLTNGVDQRKINCVYAPATNAITGQTTLYLVKRPGVTEFGGSYGTAGQTAYLNTTLAAAEWVFSTSGNDIRASSSAATTVIVTAAGYVPRFVGKTAISGTETIVLQISDSVTLTPTYRVFFASAIGTWTEITDGDFPASTLRGKMEFMDGYAFCLAADNKIRNSDLNSLSAWTATNFLTKQIKQDFPVGLAKHRQQILAFGRETVEVFVNVGNQTGSPLNVVKELASDVGISPPELNAGVTHYYAILEPRMYFVGRKTLNSNSKSFFSYDGSRFEKVSSPFIDGILSSATIFSVSKIVFNGREAIAIGLDTAAATTQRSLLFFPDWKEWFEWSSTVFKPMGNGSLQLGVDQNQHKLYYFAATDKWQDDSTNYTMTVQFQLPKNGQHRKFMRWAGVDADTARSAQSLSVEFSDDDYQTFSAARTIDMTAEKKHIYRAGSYLNRVVRLSHSGNTEVRLQNFLARVD